jgi:hypothetical protein
MALPHPIANNSSSDGTIDTVLDDAAIDRLTDRSSSKFVLAFVDFVGDLQMEVFSSSGAKFCPMSVVEPSCVNMAEDPSNEYSNEIPDALSLLRRSDLGLLRGAGCMLKPVDTLSVRRFAFFNAFRAADVKPFFLIQRGDFTYCGSR